MSSIEQEFLEFEVSHLREENLQRIGEIVFAAFKVDHRIETAIKSPDRFVRSRQFADTEVPVGYVKVTYTPLKQDELVGGLSKVKIRVPNGFPSLDGPRPELHFAFLGLVGRNEDQANSNYLLTKAGFTPYGSAEDLELKYDKSINRNIWHVKPDQDAEEVTAEERLSEEKIALTTLQEVLGKYVLRTSLKDGSVNSEEAA